MWHVKFVEWIDCYYISKVNNINFEKYIAIKVNQQPPLQNLSTEEIASKFIEKVSRNV
jgi:hypothetical protein